MAERPDIGGELRTVLSTIEDALAHHRYSDQAAGALYGNEVTTPLTVRLEFAAKGLSALIRHEFPDPQGESQ
jgi:hypothetical protein